MIKLIDAVLLHFHLEVIDVIVLGRFDRLLLLPAQHLLHVADGCVAEVSLWRLLRTVMVALSLLQRWRVLELWTPDAVPPIGIVGLVDQLLERLLLWNFGPLRAALAASDLDLRELLRSLVCDLPLADFVSSGLCKLLGRRVLT